MLTHALQLNGYRVWTASTGDEAVELARLHPKAIHLAMLDLDMDGMEDLRALQLLRELSPEMSCCLLTTDPCSASEVSLPDGRRYRVLVKPFRIANLFQVLHELLDPSQPA